MKLLPFRIIAFCFSSAIIFASCSKPHDDIITTTPTPSHKSGLNPMQPSDWVNAPVFSAGNIPQGIPGIATLPGAYVLNAPNVRDQGQIGSCTGFCGTEANEIIKYYGTTGNSHSITGTLDYANGLATAIANQIPNTSQTSHSAALSPLFLYYVERVVIEHQSIGSDPGANMVNIGQALQGLSNNTGTGSNLTTSQKVQGKNITTTYTGESEESFYTYPWTNGSGGYNVASPSSGNYKTVPSTSAITNAALYDLAKNPAGSSTSGGNTTTGGYYVISSSGSTLINDVETAIASNLPVMMGFNIYDNNNYQYFDRLNASNYVYNPLNSSGNIISGLKPTGGHAVPIIGYITNASDPNIPSSYGGGVFIIQNSWGTPWGYNGLFYLPFNVLTNTKIVTSGDLWVLVK